MLQKIWEKYSYVILFFVVTFLSFYIVMVNMIEEDVEVQEQNDWQQWEIVVNE